MQCSTGAPNPTFEAPRSAQWNADVQRAVTNNLTLDIAYVGNHGFREQFSTDLNNPALGIGWNTPNTGTGGMTPAAFCLASAPLYTQCGTLGTKTQNTAFNNAVTANEVAARPYNATLPYLNYIIRPTYQGFSNYDGLQVTASERVAHGLSFLLGYTYSHGLDVFSKNSSGSILAANPGNLSLLYGNSDNDIRHRFTFSPTYLIPGMKSPGQMLKGWSVSGIVVLQSGLPWGPVDNAVDDFLATGENKDNYNSTNSGVFEPWNYTGPRSAFNETQNQIPCYGVLSGCKAFTSATAAIQTACTTAATAPYGGSTTTNGMLALAALANSACYIQNGGVLTPPAYGTIGDAGRNPFHGQPYYNVDMSVAKIWTIRERYSAEFRMEFFNLFNRADYAAPTSIDPSAGAGGGFGTATSTPDSGNAVLGSGGPRHIQFGLKLKF